MSIIRTNAPSHQPHSRPALDQSQELPSPDRATTAT